MSSPPKIIPNLINTLLDWTNQYELDDLTLTAHKKLILDFRESLEGLQDSMKKLKNLHDTQTDGYLKFALGESVTIGEDDESRVKDFIENVCEEMVAWKLTEDTEVIDLEEDMDDENGLYDRIFKNSTKLKELISGIKERNQDRREADEKVDVAALTSSLSQENNQAPNQETRQTAHVAEAMALYLRH